MNDDRWSTLAYHRLVERNGICITPIRIYRCYNGRYRYAATGVPVEPKSRCYFRRQPIWRFRIYHHILHRLLLEVQDVVNQTSILNI